MQYVTTQDGEVWQLTNSAYGKLRRAMKLVRAKSRHRHPLSITPQADYDAVALGNFGKRIVTGAILFDNLWEDEAPPAERYFYRNK